MSSVVGDALVGFRVVQLRQPFLRSLASKPRNLRGYSSLSMDHIPLPKMYLELPGRHSFHNCALAPSS
jgi:hypothetical protein